ncbi:hypothetical protein [Leptothermofonsia sp. ETS-13]|uniref:hypothetical protein n=1 Tax=Leptothermofonsia sp. ETS-13 TaxID=3035696 RepID=UPI003B9FCEF5
MKYSKTIFAVTLAIASLGITVSAKADTVTARCDVFPRGEDRATSSGLCTFSQRQGFVSIELQDGRRYELSPVGDQPGNYLDQNGRAAYRQSGMGDGGHIYRLATESIFVYWDTTPYKEEPQNAQASNVQVGDPVPGLQDLVGARAGQAEDVVIQRGYEFVKSEPSGDSVYGYWRETRTNSCAVIRTADGRYKSIVYGLETSCDN